MKRLLIVCAAALLGLGLGQRTPFADVSPCHWASEAVGGIAGTPEVDVDQARASAYLAENALRQVFEGLVCGDLGWSAGFLSGTPEGTVSVGTLERYSLDLTTLALDGDRGSATFALTTTIDGVTRTQSAQADLLFTNSTWKVAYPSLAALDLPLFP